MPETLHDLEQALAWHCAPALEGEKPANLLCLCARQYPTLEAQAACYDRSLQKSGLRFRVMGRRGERALLLVYRPVLMREHLRQELAQALLRKAGYPLDAGLEPMLQCLEKRLAQSQDFPHELGLFLGYPPRDVIGFLLFGGRQSRCGGYWQVYFDPAGAKRRFARYDCCRERLCRRLRHGSSITELYRAG